jgi:hypothetical protein
MTAQAKPSLGFAIHRESWGTIEITEVFSETPLFYFGKPFKVWGNRERRTRVSRDSVFAIVTTEAEAQERVERAEAATKSLDDRIIATKESLASLQTERRKTAETILRGSIESAESAVPTNEGEQK